MKTVFWLLRDDSGASAAEYALILASSGPVSPLHPLSGTGGCQFDERYGNLHLHIRRDLPRLGRCLSAV